MKQIIFLLVAVNIELFIEKELMGQETWRFMLKYWKGKFVNETPWTELHQLLHFLLSTLQNACMISNLWAI